MSLWTSECWWYFWMVIFLNMISTIFPWRGLTTLTAWVHGAVSVPGSDSLVCIPKGLLPQTLFLESTVKCVCSPECITKQEGIFTMPLYPLHTTAKRCCISPCPAGIQAQPCWASLSDSTQTHSFPTPLEAQSLFLNFITWQISRTFHFTQSNRKRRSLNWIPRTMSHVPRTMTHILLFDSQHDWGIMWSRAASLFLHWPATAESVTEEVTQSFNNYNSLVLCATLSAYKGKYGQ